MDNQVKKRSEERRQLMLEGNLLMVIPLIALPQVASMLIDAFYNLADTFFVSQLGSAATAAVGINDSLMHTIRAVSLGFGMGASSYISRLLGAKKDDEASRAASTTLLTAMGFVAVMSVFCFVFLSPLVDLLGATESAKPYTMDYARWILLTAPFTAAGVCLNSTLRGEGSTLFAMFGSVSGCVINLALDPIFIFVLNLGVAGAAMATGISKIISFFILLSPFLRRKTLLTLSPRLFTPKKALYAEIARMGIPTTLRSSMMAVSNIVINNLAGGFGDMALAAVSVANKIMKMVASGIMGLGQGFQPIAGFCWGAKKYDRVKQAFFYTSVIGLALGALFGLVLGIFAPQILGIFSDETGMLDIGLTLVRTQCIVLPMHVWVIIASGLFQGTGKPINAAVLGLSRQVLSLIPCVLILTHFFGLNGLAHAQAASDIVSCMLALAVTIPMIREINQKQRAQAREMGEAPRGVAAARVH